MEIHVFARFHARPGQEAVVEAAICDAIADTRSEQGCLSINLFQCTVDPLLFIVHSHWADEMSLDGHLKQPYFVQFLDDIQPLIDHQFNFTRFDQIG